MLILLHGKHGVELTAYFVEKIRNEIRSGGLLAWFAIGQCDVALVENAGLTITADI